MPSSRTHSSWIVWSCLVLSLGFHPSAAWVYEATRPVPKPRLRVEMLGEGEGIVHSLPEGIRCGEDCSMELSPGSIVKLRATKGEGSTFEGWDGPCGNQSHRFFAQARSWLYRDEVSAVEDETGLADFLLDASDPELSEYPLECELRLYESTAVTARFGLPPEAVEVQTFEESMAENEELFVDLPEAPPKVSQLMDVEQLLEEALEEPLPEEEKIEEPTVPAKPVEVAKSNLKAVEVPDTNEVKEAPDDANFLSDKNRDVAEETRATETNLEKQSEGEVVASAESTLQSEEVGAEEEEIAELDNREETSLEAEDDREVAVGKERDESVRPSGEDGSRGEEGEGGNDTPKKEPGLLSMRNISGRGSLGSSGEESKDEEGGTSGKSGRRGKSGSLGPKLRLDQDDYASIVGKEAADREASVSRKKKSARRGRWERKIGMLQSTLENFTPEVRPGNQTALKTRAAPFAVYISRMHRRIHKLWGFGFLADLDSRSSTHELNNWELWTKLEIVINPDGSIDKMTIVRPSGLLTFDVAALDVIDTASPYEETPTAIRSPDGKVYMHWSFHRDWRQCGTFGAEPFILASAPSKGQRGMDDSELLGKAPKIRNKETTSTYPASSPKRASGREAEAKHTGNLWLSAFVTGKADALASLSALPFSPGGQVLLKRPQDVQQMYQRILSESKRRRVQDWAVLTAAAYRQKVGSLPSHLPQTGQEFYLFVRFDSQELTMALARGKAGFKVVALSR